VTCDEGDGDQWKSVGIALNDGPGLVAYVVQNDVDDDSRKLISTKQVTATTAPDGSTVYADADNTFKLTVTKDLTGTLSTLEDGPGGLLLSGLECHDKSSISFTQE